RITTPSSGATTVEVTSPPNPAPAVGGAFAYPSDGSVLTAQSTTASVTTTVLRNASAKAQAVVTGLSLFGGEITADGVTGSASAGTGPSGAGGNPNGSGVTNRSEEHTSELQSRVDLVCRLLLEKKKP